MDGVILGRSEISKRTIPHGCKHQVGQTIQNKNIMPEPTFKELVRIGKQLEAQQAKQDKDFQLQVNVLNAREQEIKNEVRKIFTEDYREQRRQIEQAIDFAIRTKPFWAGLRWIEKRSKELLGLVDFHLQSIGTDDTEAKQQTNGVQP